MFAGPQLACQTANDRVGAAWLLVLLLGVVAMLIKRDRGGPVFFTHERDNLRVGVGVSCVGIAAVPSAPF